MHDLMTSQTAVATDFAQALAAGNGPALRTLLAPNVEFRAVTPSQAWTFDDADEVVDTMLGRWFGGANHVDGVEAVTATPMGDLVHLAYRFRATNPGGAAVVEQQAYLEISEDGTIRTMRLVCSGYRPVVD
jgi:hypothetical protein